jgi:class 3 adenylate cyclase
MTTRRLAAILAADVVGFSSMMERWGHAPPRWARISTRSATQHDQA